MLTQIPNPVVLTALHCLEVKHSLSYCYCNYWYCYSSYPTSCPAPLNVAVATGPEEVYQHEEFRVVASQFRPCVDRIVHTVRSARVAIDVEVTLNGFPLKDRNKSEFIYLDRLPIDQCSRTAMAPNEQVGGGAVCFGPSHPISCLWANSY